MTSRPDPPTDSERWIEIVGDVVRRPAHAWTPTVHAFLGHLRSAGLDCVPEPLGIDEATETLRFLPGASGRDGWFAQHSTHGLASAARLLREVHDASVGWVPPVDARWAAAPVAGDDPVLCHGDPGPWNFVWDGDDAIGLVDWDFLHPGPRLDDVAYALRWFAPARSDEHALEWHHFPQIPDRADRIRRFRASYGDAPGLERVDWVEAMAKRVDATLVTAHALAAQGIEPQATWARDGSLDAESDDAAWIRAHRDLLE